MILNQVNCRSQPPLLLQTELQSRYLYPNPFWNLVGTPWLIPFIQLSQLKSNTYIRFEPPTLNVGFIAKLDNLESTRDSNTFSTMLPFLSRNVRNMDGFITSLQSVIQELCFIYLMKPTFGSKVKKVSRSTLGEPYLHKGLPSETVPTGVSSKFSSGIDLA